MHPVQAWRPLAWPAKSEDFHRTPPLDAWQVEKTVADITRRSIGEGTRLQHVLPKQGLCVGREGGEGGEAIQ